MYNFHAEMKKIAFLLIFVIIEVQSIEWTKLRERVSIPIPIANHDGNLLSSPRIIGGDTAPKGGFPHQVAISIDGRSFCGGSLISSTVVVTAAHCTYKSKLFTVALGAHDISQRNEVNRIVVDSTNKINHPDYNPYTLNNDIALVVLPAPVTGIGIAPIRLPSRSQQIITFEGSRCQVSGWGKTADNTNEVSPLLKYANVTVISNQQCARSYLSYINSSKMCTDSQGGTQGTCNGDSGGPLVFYENGERVPTLLGVVSFGSGSGCESGAPPVFTRVSSYLDWLEKTANVNIRA